MSWSNISTTDGLFASVVAVAFAYEGWIIATTINSELKDSKTCLRPWYLDHNSRSCIYCYYIGLSRHSNGNVWKVERQGLWRPSRIYLVNRRNFSLCLCNYILFRYIKWPYARQYSCMYSAAEMGTFTWGV